MRIATLKLTDLDSGNCVYITVLANPGRVACSVIPEGSGDIEVALELDDCKQIVALLEQANKSDADYIQAPDKGRLPLAHRFKNLDGGEEATLFISRKDNSLGITVERSDEGEVGFCISVEDAKNLVDALTSALMLASASISK